MSDWLVTFVLDQVIGGTGVFVPTHLYKVILAEKSSGDSDKETGHFMAAFVVPNKHISKEKTLKDFWYTISGEERTYIWMTHFASSGFQSPNWSVVLGIGSIQDLNEVQSETFVKLRVAMWA